MTKEHEQAIKNLESFIDHFHTNIKQAEKVNDCAFDFTQAEDDIITFGIAIQAIKDLDTYREPYNKGYEDGVRATNKDARIYIEDVLDKIRAEIETWHKEGTNWSDIRLMEIEDILDEYEAESEGKE